MSKFNAGSQYPGDDKPEVEQSFDDAKAAREWLAGVMREDAGLSEDGAKEHETAETIGPVLEMIETLRRAADAVEQGEGVYSEHVGNYRYYVEAQS